jgi:CRISPR-associated protein Cas1
VQTLYLNEHGLTLKKKSNRIIVKKEGRIIQEIPVVDLKRLFVFGNSQLSTELMRYLASRGIEIAFLSMKGRFRYRLTPETSKNIFLRLAQHEKYREHLFRLQISRNFVRAKIWNQRSLLIRYQRNQPDTDLRIHINFLKSLLPQIDHHDDLQGIMGIEGRAAKMYFAGFNKLLQNGFELPERKYYPAPDPVNAMLSFGYMIVLYEIQSLLEAHGFDVYLGFMHSLRYGRASLATDLLEEFRSPIIDRLVLYLINKKIIKIKDFKKDNQDKGVILSDQARKIYLSNYDKFMATPFHYKKDNTRKTYRKILRDQSTSLERVVLGSHVEYKPYVFYS